MCSSDLMIRRPPDNRPHVPSVPILRPVCAHSYTSTANSVPDHPASWSPPTSPDPRPASGPFAWPSSARLRGAESSHPDGPVAALTPSALAGSLVGKRPWLGKLLRRRPVPMLYIRRRPRAVATFHPAPSPARRNVAERRSGHPCLQNSSQHNWMEMLFLNTALAGNGQASLENMGAEAFVVVERLVVAVVAVFGFPGEPLMYRHGEAR